ncbi:thioredoxin domain-containing protein [uncultured Thiocystis sp.]|jgi:putative thioredoxin|uniref:thioredoxin family protein n=1 Tax=uncultured Thiocystis sp. TaxID=1202134 RepID=UPI0025F3DA5A|nr:thioredoxin domain-containing protein [uncultured Thiocystis sp.]
MSHPNHPHPNIFDVDTDRFQAEVLDASRSYPILVDFWADWCAPCRALSPHLERVIEDLDGQVRLAKLEVDEGENMRQAGHYKVRGFPTVILFWEGRELSRFSGARSRYQIREWLQQHLVLSGDIETHNKPIQTK